MAPVRHSDAFRSYLEYLCDTLDSGRAVPWREWATRNLGSGLLGLSLALAACGGQDDAGGFARTGGATGDDLRESGGSGGGVSAGGSSTEIVGTGGAVPPSAGGTPNTGGQATGGVVVTTGTAYGIGGSSLTPTGGSPNIGGNSATGGVVVTTGTAYGIGGSSLTPTGGSPNIGGNASGGIIAMGGRLYGIGGSTLTPTGGTSSGGTAGGGTIGSGGSASGGIIGTAGTTYGIGGSTLTPTGGSGPTDPASGCGKPEPAQAPSTVTVDGTARTFIVDLPAAYDGSTPFPIVFGMHGTGSDGAAFRSRGYGNLGSTMGTEYILVFPNALGTADDPTTRWDVQGDQDLNFFDALLGLMESSYCIDAERVFVTGHSLGGFMTNVLGCKRGNLVRAIAPMSGAGPSMGGFDPGCAGPVAAWIAHGNADTTVELSMGEGSRDYWVQANHCDIDATTTPSASYPCVEYGGCDAGFPVRWCVYDGQHELAPFAQQAIYDFFSLFK